jgi:glycosyltransferase involved in cell wall biosynthesis
VKILAWGNQSGSQFWRLVDPLKYLNKLGHEAIVTNNCIATCLKEGLLDWADVYVPQAVVDKEGLAVLYSYQQEQGKKIVIDADDEPKVTKDNPHWKEHQVSDANRVITRFMQFADMLTTTNETLSKSLRRYNKNVVVLPNYMDFERWGVPTRKNESNILRLGWVGSITHWYDLKMIEKPIKRILKEFPNVMLLLMGDPRYKEMFKGYNVEVMLGVPFDAYPYKLASLGLDIGLAPLRPNPFNSCKSYIKWLEYSLHKVPGVFSPTVYGGIGREFDGKWGMIAENEEQWYRCIKNYVVCKNLRDDIGNSAYSRVKSHYSLAQNAYKWEQAYKSLFH